MPAVRIHTKNSAEIFEFLRQNKKKFNVEKTNSGLPTYNFKDKAIYVRDKAINRGALNKIMTFQTQVSKSELYDFLSVQSVKSLQAESEEIERTLFYKGFIFNPLEEQSFQNVIKIDFNTAYWQTCRYFGVIKGETYRDIVRKCTKPTRLRITGTLGKQDTITEYDLGKKIRSYPKKGKKRRVIFQNIYNRLRKFVDELMIWCWQKNPANFIGYYVDCVWLREYDSELIEKLRAIYKLKIELVDLQVKKNAHGKIVILENNEDKGEQTQYDAQFKSNEFVIYKKLYNFTPDLKDINLKIIC